MEEKNTGNIFLYFYIPSPYCFRYIVVFMEQEQMSVSSLKTRTEQNICSICLYLFSYFLQHQHIFQKNLICSFSIYLVNDGVMSTHRNVFFSI